MFLGYLETWSRYGGSWRTEQSTVENRNSRRLLKSLPLAISGPKIGTVMATDVSDHSLGALELETKPLEWKKISEHSRLDTGLAQLRNWLGEKRSIVTRRKQTSVLPELSCRIDVLLRTDKVILSNSQRPVAFQMAYNDAYQEVVRRKPTLP